MGFSSSTQSLSALTPVKFTYNFNAEEKLTGYLSLFNNGFGYYKHNAFENFRDAALSNKTCLILTENKPLKDIFDSDSEEIDIGKIAGCVFLKNSTGKYVTGKSSNIYIGGTGERLLISIVPLYNNVVELKVGRTKYVQIDAQYPYTAKLSQEPLIDEEIDRQRFEIDYKKGLVSFKTKTAEGYRYLSYGADNVIRAVGLMLNDTIVNPYLFNLESITDNELYYNFDAKASEIKYYNELADFTNRYNTNIKEEQDSSTNLLMSCSTASIALSSKVSLNIALTKTNFSSSGSYSTKRTL